MQILILPSVKAKIRRYTKKFHPNEFFCILLGTRSKYKIFITDIYVPPTLVHSTSTDQVLVDSAWFKECQPKQIVGNYHSHPDQNFLDVSEQDQDFIQWFRLYIKQVFVFGLGCVWLDENLQKRTRMRFWPYA